MSTIMCTQILTFRMFAQLLILSLLACAGAFGQSQLSLDKHLNDYDKVLDILFPAPQSAVDDVFVLHVVAALEGEPEFAIMLRQRGRQATVEIMSSTEAIASRVNHEDYQKSGKQPQEIARTIKVRREGGGVASAQLFAWQKQFWTSLQTSAEDWERRSAEQSKTGAVRVTLDGGSIKISYGQGLNTLSLHVEDDKQKGLGRWVRDVRRAAESQFSSAH
jgi:hypothetical protein